MDDHRRLHLRQDAVVDVGVVVGRFRACGERAARHEDDAAAELLDRAALLFVRSDNAGQVRVRDVVGAGAGPDVCTGELFGGGD
jgi:hypothetical protein